MLSTYCSLNTSALKVVNQSFLSWSIPVKRQDGWQDDRRYSATWYNCKYFIYIKNGVRKFPKLIYKVTVKEQMMNPSVFIGFVIRQDGKAPQWANKNIWIPGQFTGLLRAESAVQVGITEA